jgi:2,4-dienoyl-CoA reductase-like NADH-dependent reductase (Old Yellow Enzyme family)/thioredoxin reductase
MKYPGLFEPLRLGKLELRNRVVMPPMTTGFARDGFVTDTMIDYYAARAAGGAGLVIVEDSIVATPLGKHGYNDIYIDDDKFVPDLGRLARAIKDSGAAAAIQLNFSGRMAGKLRDGRLMLTEGQIPVAPSAIAYPATGFVVPHELTVAEIEAIEDRFAEAARRAREAGFDMISLHCSHQFLIEQFLSPLSNQRRDAYGGSPGRRQRFVLEIIARVRQKTGDSLPIICRVSGKEVLPGGLTIEDACRIALSLEKAGVVALNVSHGANPAGLSPRAIPPLTAAPKRKSRGELVPLAAAIRQAVSIPVMTVGGIITPQLAGEILSQGQADLVCIGKGLITDPEWPVKAREGRESEIRHCIACEHCFSSVGGVGLTCAINPAVGRERASKLTPVARPKKVSVAGGGPAGLEAARVAAARGHRVTLYEKDGLGGQLNMACLLPGKDEYEMFLNYEKEQLRKLKVTIEKRELDREMVVRESPDAVIVATGAVPRKPALSGIDGDNVVTAWQVLRGAMPRDKKVVVIGGGSTGAGTALMLALNGNKVTVVEKLGGIAADTAGLPFYHLGLRNALEVLGVSLRTETTAEKITGNGVVVSTRGQRRNIGADMVVIALGAEPDRRLAEQLAGTEVELYAVGDCAGVANLHKAVKEGFQAGLSV